jgi:hypothetical protein
MFEDQPKKLQWAIRAAIEYFQTEDVPLDHGIMSIAMSRGSQVSTMPISEMRALFKKHDPAMLPQLEAAVREGVPAFCQDEEQNYFLTGLREVEEPEA